MKENLEGMGEVDEILVVACEENSLLALVAGKMEAKDVLQEEVRL